MGLYDYLYCELPLPIGQDWQYQTKDTETQYMMVHTINAAGRLILHDHDMEATPPAELPYAEELARMAPNDPGRRLLELFGCMRKVTGSDRDVDQNFDGDLHFYSDVHYRATFREGNCLEICILQDGKWQQIYRAPTAAEGETTGGDGR